MTNAPVIGLLNNMPDAALNATEIQFRTLLDTAVPGCSPRLVLLALPGLPRAGLAAEWVQASYRSATELEQLGLDGLIVTGMEPRSAALDEDPCWGELTSVVDAAVRLRLPTVFSCLAAHAAVLRLDGIQRRRRPEKLSGLLRVTRSESRHGYAAGLPESWVTPHSRWNGLDESALREAGYDVLSLAGGEVDAFASRRAPLLFLQGHPEYDRSALMHEYLRDARRFLAGTADAFPALPQGYFDAATETALLRVQAAAVGGGGDALMEELCRIARGNQHRPNLRVRGASLFGNWLASLPTQMDQLRSVVG